MAPRAPTTGSSLVVICNSDGASRYYNPRTRNDLLLPRGAAVNVAKRNIPHELRCQLFFTGDSDDHSSESIGSPALDCMVAASPNAFDTQI